MLSVQAAKQRLLQNPHRQTDNSCGQIRGLKKLSVILSCILDSTCFELFSSSAAPPSPSPPPLHPLLHLCEGAGLTAQGADGSLANSVPQAKAACTVPHTSPWIMDCFPPTFHTIIHALEIQLAGTDLRSDIHRRWKSKCLP